MPSLSLLFYQAINKSPYLRSLKIVNSVSIIMFLTLLIISVFLCGALHAKTTPIGASQLIPQKIQNRIQQSQQHHQSCPLCSKKCRCWPLPPIPWIFPVG